jgi:hypothetical protein
MLDEKGIEILKEECMERKKYFRRCPGAVSVVFLFCFMGLVLY